MIGAKYVVIALGSDEYALSIEHVKEITRLGDVRAIPDAPYYLQGLINLRGQAIPLINLHSRFGTDRLAKENKKAYALITDFKGVVVALSVDEVREVRTLEEIGEPPQLLHVPYISGVINQSGRIIMKLDLEKMLKDSGLEDIADTNRG